MDIAWIIIGILLWIAAIWAMVKNQLLAPALSYCGLLSLSMASRSGVALLPINNTILIAWLCMTLVVMLATLMQPAPVRMQTRGTAYITVGAFAGLAVGLLGFTVSASLSLLYGAMVIGVAAGVFFGYLLFTNTPAGAAVGIRTGNFFRYLLAKGFPIAISVMIMGVVAVILLAMAGI